MPKKKASDDWPDRYVSSQKEIAAFFGRSSRMVEKWALEGMPEKGPNGYDMLEIVRWRNDTLSEQAAGRQANKDESKSEQERIKLMLQNHKIHLELRKMQGELIERSAAEQNRREMGNRLRQRIQAIPAEAASSFPPAMRADAVADLTQRFALVLQEIASWAEEGE